MRDHLTPQPVQQWRCPATADQTVDHQQLAGNQAAQTEIMASEPVFSYLDRLDLDAVGGEVGATHPVHEVADAMGSDEGALDHLNLLEAPTSVTFRAPDAVRGASGLPLGGDMTVSTTGASFTRKQVEENAVLGDTTNTVTGAVDLAAGTARLAGSHRVHGTDGKVSNDGVGGFLQVGKDGQVVAGAGLRAGDLGASVQGMVDVAADGGLQAVGAGATVEGGGLKVGVNGAVKLGHVDVQGREVARDFGSNAALEGSWGPVGASVGTAWSYGESVTFATEAEARAYGEELEAGKHARVADLTAQDVRDLPDGARGAYVWQLDVKAGGTVLVKPEGHFGGAQKVSIAKADGDVVELTVETTGAIGGGVGFDNGFMGTSGSLDWVSEGRATYTVDLSTDEGAAAFERFQSTGDRSGLTLVESEDLSGTRSRSEAHGMGYSLTSSSERLSGERRDAEGLSALDRGAYTEDGSGDWDRYSLLASAAGITGDALAMAPAQMTGLAAAGLHGLEDWAQARRDTQYEALGSVAGRESGRLDVSTRERDGSTMALATQVVDFDDQQENARFLADQLDHTTDGPGVDPSLLPPHAKTTNEWTLETQLNPAGIANIEDVLAAEKVLPCESVDAVNAWVAARNGYAASERTAADLRDAIADAARQGEDAVECAEAMAGDGNVERFLSRAGSDVWMSAEEHAAMDERVANVMDGAKQGVPADLAELEALKTGLRDRLLQLRAQPHPEVPSKLVADEVRRIEHRLARVEAE